MDSFSTGSSGIGSPQLKTEDFIDQMKLQIAQAYAEEFLETVRTKCFDKCITKPGSSRVAARVVAPLDAWIVTSKPLVLLAELCLMHLNEILNQNM